TVRAGQVFGRVEPRLNGGDDRATLAAEVSQAQVALDSARAEQTRAERLLADRAVPARRLEDAQRAVASAEARLRAAQARLAQRDETLGSGGGAAAGNAFTIRAPIAGRVADVMATLGASYDEGAALFRIVRTDRVELRAQIPAGDVPAARSLADVAFQVPGQPDPIPLRSEHMHDAGVLDAKTGALRTSAMKRLVQWSIDHHWMVTVLSALLLAAGIWTARDMPVDVFPDLTAPTVTILTEGRGMAAEEMESLVTFPIESAINGAA